VKVRTIRFVLQDEDEEDYFRAVWYLAGALLVVGARSRVVPVSAPPSPVSYVAVAR